MKKLILFLTLFSILSIQAQVSTGQEQEFENGIKNNAAQTVTTPINVVTQGNDGTLGKTLASNLIEVLEYSTASAMPVTGVSGKIYVTIDSGRLYRWNGTVYNELLSVKENLANKQNSLTVDGTGVKYPTVDAVNTGLDSKATIISPTLSGIVRISENAAGTTANRFRQNMAFNDYWEIYGGDLGNDKGEMVISVGDNGSDITGIGQRFRFNFDNYFNGISKNPLIINYNEIIADANFTAKKGTFTQTVGGEENLSLQSANTTIDTPFINFKNSSGAIIGKISNRGSLVSSMSMFFPSTGDSFGRFGIMDPTFTNFYMFFNGLGSFGWGNGTVSGADTGLRRMAAGTLEINNGSNGILRDVVLRSVNPSGRTLFGTTTDNGIDAIQTPGTISALPATLSNQVVVKSQLDLKANIASPTFTGVPSAPTATAGTNTTQIASTAFISSAVGLKRDITNYTFASDLYINGITVGRGGGNLDGNSANGYQSLFNNTYGYNNTANGNQALFSNLDGGQNTANGGYTLYSNTTGYNNTAIGLSALFNNTTGYSNTGGGVNALYSNATGNNNTANGSDALYSNETGSNNTVIGVNALYSNTIGSNNTANGFQSGRFIANGTTDNAITNNSVFLGHNTKALADNQTNQTVIGYDAIGNGSNTTTIGNDLVMGTFLKGRVTVNNVIRLKNYTVATLPAGVQGDSAYVTDATSPTYLGSLTGGGTVKCPVFFNGTIWVSH